MKSARFLVRISVILSALFLAACETTTPVSQVDVQPEEVASSTEQQAIVAEPDSASPQPADDLFADDTDASEGVTVAVFVADFDEQDGWHAVPLESGHLYINPEPVILRDDLIGVQAGKSEDDEGLVALSLNDEGLERVIQATTQYPDMRLALIVGNTLLAAPGYSSPVINEHLIFAVGTEENAIAVARAIAGVDDNDSGTDAGNKPAGWD